MTQGGPISGIDKVDMMRIFLETNNKGDGLPRNENTFYKQVWPQLEKIRAKDKQISAFTKLVFGQDIDVW